MTSKNESVKSNSGFPLRDLEGFNIEQEVLKEISEEAAYFYQILPLAKTKSVLEVGMANPDDLNAQEALRFISLRSKLSLKIYRVTLIDFQNAIKQYRNLKIEVTQALKRLEDELAKKIKGKIPVDQTEEPRMGEAPITKITAVILKHAQEGRASDIHIEPTEKQIKVRFRVDGVLYTSLLLPLNIHSAVISRVKILSNLKIDETRVPQDGRFQTIINAQKIDLRVSVFPTVFGEKIAVRLLDPGAGLMTFETLGLTGKNFEVLKRGIEKPFGMILLTGPTGSGKTTTLYSILQTLNKEGVNIITLEDPVEYYIEGINQSQIRPEIDYTFASGLRSILRQDPDIIMVGEIRDNETAGLAVHAALTGHLVLSTLHTNNAIGVIPRLVDMGISPFLLPSSLNIVVAQRLAKRLCDRCKKEIEAPPEISARIEKEITSITSLIKKEIKISPPYKIFEAKGCKFCANKGVKGRIGIFEILEMTPELEKIINTTITEQELLKEAKRQGMLSMFQDGVIKVLKGLISFQELLQVIEE